MTNKTDKTRSLPVPPNPAALRDLLKEQFGIHPACFPLQAGSCSPMDYLAHTFFEGRTGPAAADRLPTDCVVWANRGGGKTFLGAVATMLDLLYKPGIQVRILAGSFQQAKRMHEHLGRLCRLPLVRSALPRLTSRSLTLSNTSNVEVLAASETAIRGSRVQKLRCDEVDLFRHELWNAAQFTTRSAHMPGPWGDTVRGSVDALSTMHVPLGMMWGIVASARLRQDCLNGDTAAGSGGDESAPTAGSASSSAAAPRRVLFRWGVLDVLERCPPQRDCDTCPLLEDCRGRAKRTDRTDDPGGHVTIDDAITHKARIPLAQWQAEALCLRPSRSDAVFPEFDQRLHIFGGADATVASSAALAADGTLYAGMDFGFRSPTTIIWAVLGEDRVLRIMDCYAESGRTLAQHIDALVARTEQLAGRPGTRPRFVAVDPAGHQRSAHTGISSVALLRQAGLIVRSRPAPIHDGIQLIRTLLEDRGTGPRLLIHRRCTTLIEALFRYHYAADRPHDTSPVKDGPDHAVDALRYLVTNLSGLEPGGASVSPRSYL